MTTIKDTGAIASMTLPAGWVAYPEEELPGRRLIRKVSPYDRADVSFQSSVRGVELSSPGRDAFMRTLYSPFHNINATEINDIREVLEGFADPVSFKVEEAHTTYLNSRRIIYLSGVWTKYKLKEISCFIDLHGDSSHVQQIGLEAPVKDFEKYSELYTRDSLLSVRWQQETPKLPPNERFE